MDLEILQQNCKVMNGMNLNNAVAVEKNSEIKKRFFFNNTKNSSVKPWQKKPFLKAAKEQSNCNINVF